MITRTLQHPVQLTWRILARHYKKSFVIFWLVIAVTYIISLILNRQHITQSQWETAFGFGRIYILVIGALITRNHLPILSGHGIIRRHMSCGTLLFGASLCGVFAVIMWTGLTIEHFIYQAYGWKQVLQHAILFDNYTQFPGIIAEYLILGMLAFATSHSIAATFYRFGTAYGIGAIILVITAQILIQSGASGLLIVKENTSNEMVSLPGSSQDMIVNILFAAALLILSHLMIRTAEIKPKSR